MIALTNKNYDNLPEIQKKKDEEKKKEEARMRMKNAKKYNEVRILD